ncbi:MULTISPECIES: hypothetical protein [unclassified Clavibacter]|uniref:hypothetical protein n=1 Tax=unclassified Clavibacter TaxID=2626594 RepID=UPI0022EA7EE8|nr:hypothetical protein [Clavibacter sp. CT19]MDA3803838.1 hypothetical protein [Clavibacter sp. CT19]
MTRTRLRSRLSRILSASLVTAALATAVVVSAPGDAAEAQSGYRVCGAFNSSTSESMQHGIRYHQPVAPTIGTGLVAKIWIRGGETCESKVGFMQTYYGLAYPGSSAEFTFHMVTCEAFGTGITGTSWDPCNGLETNKIYKYTSKFDFWHPVRYPTINWWHN